MQYESVLCQCGEDKQKAGEYPDVDGSEVGHCRSQGSHAEADLNERRRSVW